MPSIPVLFAAASTSETASISIAWWGWALCVLLVTSGLSFAAGFHSARACDRRAYERARSGLTQVFQTLLKTLDASREVCALLERYPGECLQPQQAEQLDLKRAGLFEALSNLISRHAPSSAAGVEAEAAPPAPLPREKVKINWLLNPLDPVTGLPDKTAFDSNLASLLELGRNIRQISSLLLVRIDKLSVLSARLGSPDTARLVKKMAGVICRAVRDQDLVCQYGPDMLGVLLPGTDLDRGARLAGAIRDSVRGYHFRVEEDGPEVLLTASFGYTPCRPDDSQELVVNRAVDALSKSQRLGRNRLHVHDGETLLQCGTE